jgi:hypothetical protein
VGLFFLGGGGKGSIFPTNSKKFSSEAHFYLFFGEMRNISREMNSRMRSKDKLGFARKKFASPVSTELEVSSTHCESEKNGKIQ